MNENIEITLKNLIEQTYKLEKEYKNLSLNYNNIQKFLKEIIDSLGAGLWVIDKNSRIIIKNTKASKLDEIFKKINFTSHSQEIQHQNNIYAIKITQTNEHSIILATDISAEKRSARLVSMGAVAAHLSHEIRNPIGAISLLVSTLLNKSDDKNRPIIQEMQNALNRVERIIKVTLLFTKGVKVYKQNFELCMLKQACLNAMKTYDFSKDIKLDISGFNGEIFADFDLLDLVFSNFIFNAIDAIEENDEDEGVISIKHYESKEFHEFEIKDSGVNIDPNIIYEPFKTTKLKGNGLGLTLSVQIINAHDGMLSLQKNPKMFSISIPKVKI